MKIPRLHALLSFGILAGTLALCACTSEPPPAVSDGAQPAEESRVVASNLRAPWSVAFAQGTPLISERDSAAVLEVIEDGGTRTVGTIEGVVAGGEGGLLGMAVLGDSALYVYSTGETGNRVQRFPLRGSPGALALGDPETIIDRLPSAGNHNGGRIAFGPDGMLYVTSGDAGDRESAQDLETLGGKILRLTPDGEIPDDNPFPDSPVYSYGHRNPQGIAWAADGTMYASEFGQDTWDELNLISPAGNYGWPEAEGAVDDPRFIDPLQQWSPDSASPSGIAVAGEALYIANLRGERLRVVPLADPSTATELFTGELGRIRDVVVAPDGSIQLLTNNTDGRGAPREGDDRLLSIDP